MNNNADIFDFKYFKYENGECSVLFSSNTNNIPIIFKKINGNWHIKLSNGYKKIVSSQYANNDDLFDFLGKQMRKLKLEKLLEK